MEGESLCKSPYHLHVKKRELLYMYKFQNNHTPLNGASMVPRVHDRNRIAFLKLYPTLRVL
jgi:hypothetical protein